MDWGDLTESRKEEVLGFLYFNRVHEEDWVQYNSFYAGYEDHEIHTTETEVDKDE